MPPKAKDEPAPPPLEEDTGPRPIYGAEKLLDIWPPAKVLNKSPSAPTIGRVADDRFTKQLHRSVKLSTDGKFMNLHSCLRDPILGDVMTMTVDSLDIATASASAGGAASTSGAAEVPEDEAAKPLVRSASATTWRMPSSCALPCKDLVEQIERCTPGGYRSKFSSNLMAKENWRDTLQRSGKRLMIDIELANKPETFRGRHHSLRCDHVDKSDNWFYKHSIEKRQEAPPTTPSYLLFVPDRKAMPGSLRSVVGRPKGGVLFPGGPGMPTKWDEPPMELESAPAVAAAAAPVVAG